MTLLPEPRLSFSTSMKHSQIYGISNFKLAVVGFAACCLITNYWKGLVYKLYIYRFVCVSICIYLLSHVSTNYLCNSLFLCGVHLRCEFDNLRWLTLKSPNLQPFKRILYYVDILQKITWHHRAAVMSNPSPLQEVSSNSDSRVTVSVLPLGQLCRIYNARRHETMEVRILGEGLEVIFLWAWWLSRKP